MACLLLLSNPIPGASLVSAFSNSKLVHPRAGLLVSATDETEAPELKDILSRGTKTTTTPWIKKRKPTVYNTSNSKSYFGGPGFWGLGNVWLWEMNGAPVIPGKGHHRSIHASTHSNSRRVQLDV